MISNAIAELDIKSKTNWFAYQSSSNHPLYKILKTIKNDLNFNPYQ